MRQSEVQLRFLKSFTELFPRLAFRGLRRFASGSEGPFAFVLRVSAGRAGVDVDLHCVALTEGHPEEVKRFLARIKEGQPPAPAEDGAPCLPVLIAPYFSDETRATCAGEQVGCLDLAGNAHLDVDGVYLEIGGRPNPNVRERRLRTPFEGRAERVVRTLLLSPDRQWSMRELAKAADVSLGMASMVTTDLRNAGMVNKGRDGLTLLSPADLLSAWAEKYDLRRSSFRTFRSRQSQTDIERVLSHERSRVAGRYALTLWSGARHLLAEEAPARLMALYWVGQTSELEQMVGLGHVGTVNVFVFQPYDESILWRREERNGLSIVSPLQLYLDLGSGDESEVALAERVRERLLTW